MAWAIDAPTPPAERRAGQSGGGRRRLHPAAVTRRDETSLYAGVAHAGARYGDVLALRSRATGAPAAGSSRRMKRTPTAASAPDVPKGTLKQMPPWESKIFAGTTRDWWVYVPAQYKAETPASVMVFQDGAGYKDYVPTVFDNLIAKGDMPVTVGIFIQPGLFKDGRANRSFEYDTLSDQYARFLLEEILPEVEKTVKLRHDAASRAIAGASSGGICAFTVAWERPNEFSKVLSWIGSFTNIASGKTVREGGHNYEALVRKTPKKPIRVFLQDGANDLDNANGNWPLANQPMAQVAGVCGIRLPVRVRARASTATGTAGRSCPTRCAGCGATLNPDRGCHGSPVHNGAARLKAPPGIPRPGMRDWNTFEGRRDCAPAARQSAHRNGGAAEPRGCRRRGWAPCRRRTIPGGSGPWDCAPVTRPRPWSNAPWPTERSSGPGPCAARCTSSPRRTFAGCSICSQPA